MRLVPLMIAALLPAAALAAERESSVTMATPAMVQLTSWCQYGDKGCAQNAADIAQAQCQRNRRNALLTASDLIERDLRGREKYGFRFSCVP